MLYNPARFLPAGDSSLIMEFGDRIDPNIHERIRSMLRALEKHPELKIEEVLPTYRSLHLFYSPLLTDMEELTARLKEIEKELPSEPSSDKRIVEIPTLYGGEYGPDLLFVAKSNHLTPEEVIEIHHKTDYLLYMLGFTPGFSYLGGMNERIATPRLTKPRTIIPAGSVGIAGSQTGIYPIDSPGGWQLIGRTPITLYDPHAETPVFLKPGDIVRFVPITKEDYLRIQQEVKAGIYSYHILVEEVQSAK